ncbi:MAG: hypothetical protein PHW04_15995 [Candidatus Wallbacteria bacterium]|nr:hypothetical protein [Candidatus Wallbacteria bacterium]
MAIDEKLKSKLRFWITIGALLGACWGGFGSSVLHSVFQGVEIRIDEIRVMLGGNLLVWLIILCAFGACGGFAFQTVASAFFYLFSLTSLVTTSALEGGIIYALYGAILAIAIDMRRSGFIAYRAIILGFGGLFIGLIFGLIMSILVTEASGARNTPLLRLVSSTLIWAFNGALGGVLVALLIPPGRESLEIGSPLTYLRSGFASFLSNLEYSVLALALAGSFSMILWLIPYSGWAADLFLSFVISAILFRLLLILKKKSRFRVQELQQDVGKLPQLLVGGFVLSICAFFGFGLMVLPGLLICGLHFFVPVLMVDRKLHYKEAFELSRNAVQSAPVFFTVFISLLLLLNLAAVLLYFVGLIVTVPVSAWSILHLYEDRF